MSTFELSNALVCETFGSIGVSKVWSTIVDVDYMRMVRFMAALALSHNDHDTNLIRISAFRESAPCVNGRTFAMKIMLFVDVIEHRLELITSYEFCVCCQVVCPWRFTIKAFTPDSHIKF